jgi:hypothetical protein
MIFDGAGKYTNTGKQVPGEEMPSAPTKPTSAAPASIDDAEQLSPRIRAEIGKLSPPLQAGMADIVRRKQGQA